MKSLYEKATDFFVDFNIQFNQYISTEKNYLGVILHMMCNEETYHSPDAYRSLLTALRSYADNNGMFTNHPIFINDLYLTPESLNDFVIEHGDAEARAVALRVMHDMRSSDDAEMKL